MRLTPADVAHLADAQARNTAELVKPCTCSRPNCRTIGEHIWWATKEAAPGIKAANMDPGRSSGTGGITIPDPRDAALAHEHATLHRLLADMADNTRAFQAFLDRWAGHRERVAHVDESDWCRHHLETTQACEPRYRGDLCRRCYDFGRAQGHMPPAILLTAWHRGERVNARQVAEAMAEVKAATRRRRKQTANRKRKTKT